MDERIAEGPIGTRVYHVVRKDDRYACGMKRAADADFLLMPPKPAWEVTKAYRCNRIGCANDFAKADRQAGK